MNIIEKDQIDLSTLKALDKLVKQCQKVDGHHLPHYGHLLLQRRPKPSTLLCYEHQTLIGFAAAFFFEQDLAEIIVFIHPKYRKKGAGGKMILRLYEHIQQYHPVMHIRFPVPSGQWRKKFQQNTTLKPGHTEIEMRYKITHLQQPPISTCNILTASFEDVPILSDLDRRCFPVPLSYSELRFETQLRQKTHDVFILYEQDQPIGKIHIAFENEIAHLNDIAIIPEKRRLGFGAYIITYAIQHCQQRYPHYPIHLSVEAHNQHALALYKKIGFEIINIMDYWQSDADDLYAHPFPFKMRYSKKTT